jgi:hypothetical protein
MFFPFILPRHAAVLKVDEVAVLPQHVIAIALAKP